MKQIFKSALYLMILVSLSFAVLQIVTPYDKCDVYDSVDRVKVETCQ